MIPTRTTTRIVKSTGWSFRVATASSLAPMDFMKPNWPLMVGDYGWALLCAEYGFTGDRAFPTVDGFSLRDRRQTVVLGDIDVCPGKRLSAQECITKV